MTAVANPSDLNRKAPKRYKAIGQGVLAGQRTISRNLHKIVCKMTHKHQDVMTTSAASVLAPGTFGLGVLKRGDLNLIVEIAALVVPNEMRANILIAGGFGGLRLVLEAA